MNANETKPEEERLDPSEFVLDLKEKDRLEEETRQAVAALREDIEYKVGRESGGGREGHGQSPTASTSCHPLENSNTDPGTTVSTEQHQDPVLGYNGSPEPRTLRPCGVSGGEAFSGLCLAFSLYCGFDSSLDQVQALTNFLSTFITNYRTGPQLCYSQEQQSRSGRA